MYDVKNLCWNKPEMIPFTVGFSTPISSMSKPHTSVDSENFFVAEEIAFLNWLCMNVWCRLFLGLTPMWYHISWIRCCGYCFFHCLFLCGYYSRAAVISPADVNNGWIRYIWAIQWRLLDAVSSMRSLSVRLSTMEMSCTTQTALALAWWLLSERISHTCVLHLLATVTIRLFGEIWYF